MRNGFTTRYIKIITLLLQIQMSNLNCIRNNEVKQKFDFFLFTPLMERLKGY